MMARKHSKHGPYEDFHLEADAPAPVVSCWLCGRPTGKTIVWHHPVPKSRGGQDVVPMHPICQKTLIANFTNSELQRYGMDVRSEEQTSELQSIMRISYAVFGLKKKQQ